MTDAAAVEGTGPRLKAERERRGLSSQKAADELHLDGWVVDALEAENYERVGPSVYAKGHLKRYAALLGLPVEEIMAGYESRSLAPKTVAAPLSNVRLRTDTPAVSNLPWTQIVGSAAVLLLVVGVLWWKPWHQRGATPANKASAAASVNGSAAGAPPTALVDAETTPLAMVPQSSAPPAVVPDAPAGSGRARLRLSFSADSWVDVHDAEGRRVFAGNGRANTMRSLSGIAPMRVYLGIASGVQLEINNRAVAIGPQFVFGEVARFEAGADGVLRRDTRGGAPGGAGTPAVATPAVAMPGALAPVGQARNARPTG